MRHGLRFVTLTLASGPSLETTARDLRLAVGRLTRSRAWRGWVEGKVEKTEVTWNLEAGWHPHVHAVVSGAFIPHDWRKVRHSTACRRAAATDPDSARCSPTCPPNLRDEWVRATGGRGSIVDVREVDVSDPLAFARELAKYVAKPFASGSDGGRVELADWPVPVRLELALWVGGGTRTVWRCASHGSMSRRRCLAIESARWPCEGRYAREWVGARRVRWSGTLRSIHREAEAEREAESVEGSCRACGKGPTLSAWMVRRRVALGWPLPPGVDVRLFDPPHRLPSIQAHNATGTRAGRAEGSARMRIDSAEREPATGGSGPPFVGWSA